MTSGPLGRDFLQSFADRLKSLTGLGSVRTATLGHVGPPAAALPAQGRDRCLDQFNSAHLTGEIVGDAHGDAGAAFIDGDKGGNTASKALFHTIDLAAKSLGIKAIDHLTKE